jgi:hypothetical protein
MRYQVICVLAALSSLPLRTTAQEEASTPNRRQPQSEPAQEAPTLRLELDSAGVGVVSSPARTVDGYTLKKMERRVQRAKRGLGVAVVPLVAGGLMVTGGAFGSNCFLNSEAPNSCARVRYGGAGLAAVGAAGMIAIGILLGVRKRKLRTLQEVAYREGRRRAQWDLVRSRLVF